MFSERERNEAKKIRLIQTYLDQSPIDIEGLKQCSISEFGFVNNVQRKRIWPILLRVDTRNLVNHQQLIINHSDTDQVLKDVERSMWRFTKGRSQLRNRKKPELMNIVNAVLSKHKELNYFQGYHEIGSVLLLATDEPLAYAMLEKLSRYHFRDCMFPTFSPVLSILNLLFPLLSFVNKEVYEFIIESKVQNIFAISWIITWFAHNLNELDDAARLFDYFLSSHPLSSLYFSVILIDHLKDGLLRLECTYDQVHGYFSNLPENLPLDKLIQKTNQLLINIPPNKLQTKTKQFLLEDSQMNLYPYEWMKKPVLNNKFLSKKKGIIDKISGSKSSNYQIYKYAFLLVFGSISIFSIFVYISIHSPSTVSHMQYHLKQYLPTSIFRLLFSQTTRNSINNNSIS